MDDVSWTVRRQLAASIGALPLAARVERATAMLERYGDDQILVDAALSGLRGQEPEVFDRMLRGAAAQRPDAVAMLAATIARSAEAANVASLISRVTDPSAAAWQRAAVLQGLELGLPVPGGGRGAGGRGRGVAARGVVLASEPTGLTQFTAGDPEMVRLARSVAARLDWPGKPAPVVIVTPLTPEEQRRFDAGAELYKNICIACHQADGRGREKMAPTLVGSRYVVSQDGGNAARILLGGKEGPVGLMPPLASALNDDQIAAVLTYIRREWGHTASAVAPDEVKEIRGLTKTRTRPWTDAELPQGRGGRAGGAF
jgi:mono/diheme cytochrome c family protein